MQDASSDDAPDERRLESTEYAAVRRYFEPIFDARHAARGFLIGLLQLSE